MDEMFFEVLRVLEVGGEIKEVVSVICQGILYALFVVGW